MFDVTLMVIAKEPLPGRVKTRLCPPLNHDQAARLACAALRDTISAVARTPARRRVLVFDGDDSSWRGDGFEVVPQRGAGLAARLASAFEDVGGPALLVGMDTPQLTPELLLDGVRALERATVDAVFGPSLDGGYWCAGLKSARRDVFDGIPMSEPRTWAAQRARIEALGLRLHEHPRLRDVDTFADAHAVAREAPESRFAAELTTISC